MAEGGAGMEGRAGGADRAPRGESSMTFLELVNLMLRERRLVVFTTLAVAVLMVGWVLLQERTYTSRAAFVPDAGSSTNALLSGGLASQLGLRNMSAGPGPEFYAALLVSRPVLEQAVVTEYTFAADSGSVTADLVEVYGKDPDGPRERRVERTVRELDRDLDIQVTPATGVVELAVSTRYPELSQAVAGRLVGSVNEFDSRRRRSEASEDMRFLEERMGEARAELLEAETELQEFLSGNRYIGSSPELTFQRDRLQRVVGMRQGVYNSLAETYESARIEEARTTPVITILAPPQVPAIADRRGLAFKGAFALMAGFLLGVILAVLRERVRRARQEDAGTFEHFQRLRGEAILDLRHPLRLLQRRSPPVAAGGDGKDAPPG